MSIILWIIGGIIGLAAAIILFKLAAAFLGLSLLLGGLTWLIFDSFWTGAIIGFVITLIMFFSDPGEFLDNAMESYSGSSGSSGTSSSGSSTSSSSSSSSSDNYPSCVHYWNGEGLGNNIAHHQGGGVYKDYDTGQLFHMDYKGNLDPF